MTHEEKGLLTNYLVDAGEIDPDGDVEAQFLEWYQVREGVVSGETHYKAVLEAGRVRKRSFERGSRLAAVVRAVDGEPLPSGDGRGFCDHDTPCSCYAEGYATGRVERHEKTPVDFSKLRRVLDHIYRGDGRGEQSTLRAGGLAESARPLGWRNFDRPHLPPGSWSGLPALSGPTPSPTGPIPTIPAPTGAAEQSTTPPPVASGRGWPSRLLNKGVHVRNRRVKSLMPGSCWRKLCRSHGTFSPFGFADRPSWGHWA